MLRVAYHWNMLTLLRQYLRPRQEISWIDMTTIQCFLIKNNFLNLHLHPSGGWLLLSILLIRQRILLLGKRALTHLPFQLCKWVCHFHLELPQMVNFLNLPWPNHTSFQWFVWCRKLCSCDGNFYWDSFELQILLVLANLRLNSIINYNFFYLQFLMCYMCLQILLNFAVVFFNQQMKYYWYKHV